MKFLNYCMFVLLVLVLESCGGGGGGSVSGTPDNPPLSSSSSSTSTSTSSSSSSSTPPSVNTVTLTVSGQVGDAQPIVNADVVFSVRDLQFSARTDANGKYTVDLKIDGAHMQDLVVATATAGAANPTLKLASQLNSVFTLLEQAGTDKLLDANDNPGTNISNWTTAEYALLTAPSYWGYISPLSTDAELKVLLQSLGNSKKVAIATNLEIIATDPRFPLPVGYKSTLEFAQEMVQEDTFVYKVYALDYPLLSTISARISQERGLVGIGSGEYILNPGQHYDTYTLKLNVDASGELKTDGFTAPFKWIRQNSTIILTFLAPVETGETDLDGKWVIKGAELSIVEQSADLLYGNFVLYQSMVNTAGKELSGRDRIFYDVEVYDQAKFISLPSDKIAGEWASDSGIYEFKGNRSATFKPYNDPTNANEFSWALDNKKLSLSFNENLNETMYLVRDLGVGYAYVKSSKLGFTKGMLIKPAQNILLNKSDLVGSWLDSVSDPFASKYYMRAIWVMTSDSMRSADFTAFPEPWFMSEQQDSWGQNFYKLGSFAGALSCEMTQGASTDCRLSTTSTNKIIAVEGNNYYSLRTWKVYYTDHTAEGTSLMSSRKLPEIRYFAPWIQSYVQKSFYQTTGTTIKVWNFWGSSLTISDRSFVNAATSLYDDYFSLKNNRLQYTRDNIPLELELIGVSEAGLKVCEFNQGSSCIAGTEFLLSNKSPAKISLNVVGAGTIAPSSSSERLLSPDALFGNVVGFDVKPEAGFVVSSVTGCGGSLHSNQFITAAIRDACTITATFEAAQ